MQKFYLQTNLTRGAVALSDAEKQQARDNLDSGPEPLALGVAPTNGVAAVRQRIGATLAATSVVGTGVYKFTFTSAIFSKAWLVPVTHGWIGSQVITALYGVLQADTAFNALFSVSNPFPYDVYILADTGAANDPMMELTGGGDGSTSTGVGALSSAITINGAAAVIGTVGVPGQIAVVNNPTDDTYIRVGSLAEPNQWLKVIKNGDDAELGTVAATAGVFSSSLEVGLEGENDGVITWINEDGFRTELSNSDTTADRVQTLPDA